MANTALVRLMDEHADASQIEEMAGRMARELAGRGLRTGSGPHSGTLAVTVGTSPEIASLVDAVCAWLYGAPGRRVDLTRGGSTFVLTGGSAEPRRLLIEWLMRQADLA